MKLNLYQLAALRCAARHGSPITTGEATLRWKIAVAEVAAFGYLDDENRITDAGRAALRAAEEQ